MSDEINYDPRLDDAAPDAAKISLSTVYRNYVLVMMTLAYTFNVVDRQILAILMEPIKRELGISDTQLGLLTGLSFGIFYAIMGIPLAMWADRGNRRNILALTMTVFSAMTVICGFATNFFQMMLGRIGVAIGEAGGSPPAHSIISDIFPPEKRVTAMGIYTAGVNVGVLLGFLVGGWISQWYGWRMAFFIVGAPGLLIAFIIRVTVREPTRGHADGLIAQGEGTNPSLSEVVLFLYSQRSFRHLACATILGVIGGTSCYTFLPSFFARSFHMAPGEIGTILALILGLIGGIGTCLNGYFADCLGKRDVRWKLWGIAIAFIVAAPFWVAMFLSDTKSEMLAFFLYPAFVAGSWMAISYAMTQAIVTVRMRTRASAVLFLISSLIGGSIGPQLTGVLSDVFGKYSGPDSMRYALLTMSFAYLWSALHYILAARTIKEDIARVRLYKIR